MNYTLHITYFHAHPDSTQLSLFEIQNKNMRTEKKERGERIKCRSSSDKHNPGGGHPKRIIDDERRLCGFSMSK